MAFLGSRRRPRTALSISFPSHIGLVDIALIHSRPLPSPPPDDAGITASLFLHYFPGFASVTPFSQYPYPTSS